MTLAKHSLQGQKKRAWMSNAIKLIVGHKIEDITESTYTDRDIEWLRQDIEKIE